MAYIGMFTDAAIQNAINRAGEKLGDGESGLVVHLDSQDEFSVSVIQRFGEHISVEAAGVMDTSDGFKFDKEHLKVQGEIIARWGK